MSEPGSRRGRAHDAEGAREAILNAAEEVFSEHGFDGARIDVIAKVSGYNKSLIFQYFDDKLRLYNEVIRRLDKEANQLQATILHQLLEDETSLTIDRFKQLLREFLSDYFDYLMKHENVMRIFMWELAEGWQTYAKIISERDLEDVVEFMPFLDRVKKARLLRSGYAPMQQFVMAEFIIPSFLSALPLYRLLVPEEDVSSPAALAQAKEFIIEFIIRGLVTDHFAAEANP
jgi:TetR/AcrR family transcriptional regulator